MSEWIKCSDRLPESRGGDSIWRSTSDRVLCLVLYRVGGVRLIEVGSCDRSLFYGWTEFETGEYRGTTVVTHWMPLPSPPEDSK